MLRTWRKWISLQHSCIISAEPSALLNPRFSLTKISTFFSQSDGYSGWSLLVMLLYAWQSEAAAKIDGGYYNILTSIKASSIIKSAKVITCGSSPSILIYLSRNLKQVGNDKSKERALKIRNSIWRTSSLVYARSVMKTKSLSSGG